MLNKIICIGDSHVSFFNGYDKLAPLYPEKGKNKFSFFETIRIGPVLAYSLIKSNTTERGREKIFELLNIIPQKSILLFCFGEIDIRCHLIKQSKKQSIPLSLLVEECVNRYLVFVKEVKQMGFEVILLGPIPTTNTFDPDYPYFGTMEERNSCTKLFNGILQKKSIQFEIDYICINKYLVDHNGQTKTEFFFDTIHLSKLSIPFVKRELFNLNRFQKSGLFVIILTDMNIIISIVLSKLKKIYRIVR